MVEGGHLIRKAPNLHPLYFVKTIRWVIYDKNEDILRNLVIGYNIQNKPIDFMQNTPRHPMRALLCVFYTWKVQ